MAKRKSSPKGIEQQSDIVNSEKPRESGKSRVPAQPDQSASTARESISAQPDQSGSTARASIPAQLDQRGLTARRVNIPAKPVRSGLTVEERNHLISRAAYFHAERRGFTPGAELEDWLKAETEIEEMLQKMIAHSQ